MGMFEGRAGARALILKNHPKGPSPSHAGGAQSLTVGTKYFAELEGFEGRQVGDMGGAFDDHLMDAGVSADRRIFIRHHAHRPARPVGF